MDEFFHGLLILVGMVLVVLLFSVIVSYLYERGIGKTFFDSVFAPGSKWKKLQFILILIIGVGVAKYLGIDIVKVFNDFVPMIGNENADIGAAVTGIVITIVSSWLHEKTGLNA